MMGSECKPEYFNVNITPIQGIVVNLFNKMLLHAFRWATFVVNSFRWRHYRSTYIHLEYFNIVFIHWSSNKVFKTIDRWKTSDCFHCPLSKQQILLVTLASFRILWKHGPNKVKCRLNESKMIDYVYGQIKMKCLSNQHRDTRMFQEYIANLPFKELPNPFNSFQL